MTEITSRLSTALTDRYRIERHLGEGGMATVYLAEDMKHKRKVAVKVLRPELAAVLGAERFVQEITTTASLQHPHILPLFDSGEADSFLYYVMPYIEGETLREKLNRETQLGIDEAVRITTEVADALDYAHRHNVIHRDIKPENILLHDGRPIVADFGIALAVSAAAGGRMTETGLSLGTPHYMSPEQATAKKDITNRSDIYSLGSVLYEMLTGEPPHTGGSAQAVIMKIVTDEARPVTELRKSVPPHVAAATAKSLEKLAADRFESAAKFAEALSDPGFTLGTTRTAAVLATPTEGPWKRLGIGAMSLLVVFAIVAFWGWTLSDGPIAVSRNIIILPDQERIDEFALSPDGSLLAYVARGPEGSQLWIKRRDEHRGTPMSGTGGAIYPFFSPDGEWLGFLANNEVRKILVSGGASVKVADSAGMANVSTRGAVWLADGSIAFIHASWDLARVAESGGPTERLVTLGEVAGFPYIRHVSAYPGGVFFTVRGVGCETAIWALDLATGEKRMLVEGGSGGRYLSSGHVLYGDCAGGVLSVGFDRRTLATTGTPIPVLNDVTGMVPALTIANESGDLLYVEGPRPTFSQMQLMWVARDGSTEPIDAGGTGQLSGPKLSPDGKRLVHSEARVDGGDIWIRDLETGRTRRITDAPGGELRPTWTPDGLSVAFVADRRNPRSLFRKRADGIGAAELVLDIQEPVNSAEWSTSGEWLVYRTGRGTPLDVYARGVGGDDTTITIAADPDAEEHSPTLSPDERWVAYVSDETGQPEVYVRPFPEVGNGKDQISIGGGTMPLWAHSGRELFFKTGDYLTVVDITTTPAFSASRPRRLFSLEGYNIPGGVELYNGTYDITPDDQRFVMMRLPEGGDTGDNSDPVLVFVENFFEEVKAKVGRE